MAIQKTDAILLRKKDLRETSLILTYFTSDFGKIHGILKGARGAKARSNIKCLFFSIDQIVFYENKKSDLFIISQCESQKALLNILKEWERVSVAYYILEIVDMLTEPGIKIEPIFESLSNSLIALDSKKEPDSIARLFEVKFLMALGLWPGVDNFKATKGAISTLSCFERDTVTKASNIKLNKTVGDEIKRITQQIIFENLNRPLKTDKVFK